MYVRPLRCFQMRPIELEDELQAQLDCAVAAGTEHGVERGTVRRSTATAKLTRHRGISKRRLAIATGSTPGIRKLGVIENIKHLGAELRLEPFPEFEALGDGKIDVVKTGIPENVAAHSAKRVLRGGNQDGFAIQADIASGGHECAVGGRIGRFRQAIVPGARGLSRG